MAVPFLAERVGLIGLAFILLVAWAASALIHLMLAEVLFRTGRDLQIVELMRLYVLRGRIGQWILWTVFALLSVAFLANLAAYVSGAGEIVSDLTEWTGALARRSSTFFRRVSCSSASRPLASRAPRCSGVVWSPPDNSDCAARLPFHARLGPTGSTTQWLALYGMVMYASGRFTAYLKSCRDLDRIGRVPCDPSWSDWHQWATHRHCGAHRTWCFAGGHRGRNPGNQRPPWVVGWHRWFAIHCLRADHELLVGVAGACGYYS